MKLCKICGGKHLAKGLCSKCYEKQRNRYKTKHQTWHLSIIEKLDLLSTPITETGCLIWLGAVDLDGYGRTSVNGKSTRAHRASYELHYGQKIPDGMCVCHKCDTPSCINPNHLFLGSIQENNIDRTVKNRGAKGSMVGISKLKEFDIPKIRADHRTQQKIAEEYGVSQVLIGKIKRGDVWAHI